MRKLASVVVLVMIFLVILSACEGETIDGTKEDQIRQQEVTNQLLINQPTPTDIDYSLERYNLIRRAYWVNGQREKARTLPSPIADIPLGYIVLFADNGAVVGRFIVEGKVTSLNSYLTPDSEYYEIANGDSYTKYNEWLADVDGSYGFNDNGIFFFTPDGKYIEWTGTYLYSDIPFEVEDPILKVSDKWE